MSIFFVILFAIYIFFCASVFGVFVSLFNETLEEWKFNNNTVPNFNPNEKRPFYARLKSFICLIILVFIPIFHILSLTVLLYNTENIKSLMYDEIVKQYGGR